MVRNPNDSGFCSSRIDNYARVPITYILDLTSRRGIMTGHKVRNPNDSGFCSSLLDNYARVSMAYTPLPLNTKSECQ